MLVTDSGEAVGSVSGGCVEGALFDVGQEVLADGVSRFETYGVSDDDAFAVGLTCGGILEVFIERVDDSTWPELEGIATSIAALAHTKRAHLRIGYDEQTGDLFFMTKEDGRVRRVTKGFTR